MKNKRGQIFLILALVIIGIIIGLSFTYTKTRVPQEEARVIDLSNEIYYEGAQVVDRGVFLDNSANIESKINELIGNYSQLNPDSEITVIYGSGHGATYSCKETGSITTGTASQTLCEIQTTSIDNPPENNQVSVVVGEETYYFDLEGEQNFFIVIKKETSTGQQIVTT